MIHSDYTNSVEINKSQEIVFESLTQHIPKWWTETFEGTSANQGDTFTVRFGTTKKTFVVEELLPNQKIVWRCTNANLEHPQVKNKQEWKDTTIIWELFPQELTTKLVLTHRGLTHEMECFEICEKGWATFLTSLYTFINSGSGLPYIKAK